MQSMSEAQDQQAVTARTSFEICGIDQALCEVREGVPLTDALNQAGSVLQLVNDVLEESLGHPLSPAVCALAHRAVIHAQAVIRSAYLGADEADRKKLSRVA